MCTHPEHRVEVLPDGQIDETHVFSVEDLKAVRLAHMVDRLIWSMQTASQAHTIPKVVVLNGQ